MATGGAGNDRTPLAWGGVQRSRRGAISTGSGSTRFVAAAAERASNPSRSSSRPALVSNCGNARRMPVDDGPASGRPGPIRRRRGRTLRPPWRVLERARPGARDPLPRLPIRAWQIWNEENFFYFTRPGLAEPARACWRSHTGRSTASTRAPTVVIAAFSATPTAAARGDGLDRTSSTASTACRGVKANFDAVALHPYAADAAELRALVEAVRGTMVRHGDRRGGLYLTEMGWGSQETRRPVSFEVGCAPGPAAAAPPTATCSATAPAEPQPGRLVQLEGRLPGLCAFCRFGRASSARVPALQTQAGLARLRSGHPALVIPPTSSTISAGAFAGEPESNGGSGSYSIPSWIAWATSGPTSGRRDGAPCRSRRRPRPR